ncbi:RNA polymerase sigma factor [Herbiconiux sp. VKM Ac-1786]|uniref:RNA polymerase sigma factor n=1 Tax=Herbiconiux sp. VKM Ac-1786 TaxID=2783824 RepID=UPI00351C996D
MWRIEGARITAGLARAFGDFGLAEDAAQDALAQALVQWPVEGEPRNPGAWLTAVAKRRAVDALRRGSGLDERYASLAAGADAGVGTGVGGGADARAGDLVGDEVLGLVFIACHPVLGRDAQVALTLRVVGGLTSEEIARLYLLPVATVQQRIVRAKKTLAAANVPFESPEPAEWTGRLGGVLAALYLIFTEGYSATSGERWLRPELADEAVRLGRVLAGLLPREPEVHALLALMELQAARFPARTAADGSPVLLADQDRRRWDRARLGRGRAALARSDEAARRRGRGRGPYALQAAIAECHAVAPDVAGTDWERIVLLYEALGALAPNPVVELNKAVAVSMAVGPASALRMVDELVATGALAGSHLVPSVRGELLAQLGRVPEARSELVAAAGLTRNERARAVLLAKAAALPGG